MIKFKMDTHELKYWVKKFSAYNSDVPNQVLEEPLRVFLAEIIDNTPLQNETKRRTWLQWCKEHCTSGVYFNLTSGRWSHEIGKLRRCWVMSENEADDGYETDSSSLIPYIKEKAFELYNECTRTQTQVYAKYIFKISNSASYFDLRDGDGHATLLPIWHKGVRVQGNDATYNSLSNELMVEDATRKALYTLVDAYYKGLKGKGLA